MRAGISGNSTGTSRTANKASSRDRQCASDVLMIRPTSFGCNDVTRPTNHFQSPVTGMNPRLLARAAVAEVNALAAALIARGVNVHLFGGKVSARLPDEVFPNNWMSTHDDGTVVLYPLLAWNRREERRRDIIDELQRPGPGFRIARLVDLSALELQGHYLEGTGSLVLDRTGKTLFACRSARTHPLALQMFSRELKYAAISFDASDSNGRPIYHTNVMMSVGEQFAVVCVDAIGDVHEGYRVLRRLEQTGREIIRISHEQMHAFAGNILELQGRDNRVIVMSARARRAFSQQQLARLERFGELIPANIGTIERVGGGSVRCMLAEIFLPRR